MSRQNDPKDQNNLIYAAIISLVVLLGWQYFIVNPRLKQEQARREFTKEVEAQKGTGQSDAPAAPPPAPPAQSSAPVAPEPPQAPMPRADVLKASPRVPVRTPSLEGSISLKGGRIDDLILSKYHETIDPNSNKVVLFSPGGTADAYFTAYGWTVPVGSPVKVPDDRDTVWKVDKGDALTPTQPVTISWDNGQGLVFSRTFSVDNDYMFKVVDEIENRTNADVALLPYARIYRYGAPKTQAYYILHEGPIAVAGAQGLQEVTYADATKAGAPKTFDNVTGGWLGITDKYWAAAIVPDQKEPYRLSIGPARDKNAFQSEYLRGAVVIPPNARKGVETHLYAGAKQMSLIDKYEQSLGIMQFDRMIDWGWFYFITRPLFQLMEWINGWVPGHNFGITILILTVLVRLAFFPIANKQYESMARMKKLQPEMVRIKEVYKDDQQRQQKEMFDLYRREKINPLAGCWPVLLQIPVFFALYKVLFVTIDMRHAPFFGWIKDLSAPDPTSIVNLFGILPFAAPDFAHIGVWPVIMGITMWLQMQLNPPQPDPVQQQVFAWMPLIFTFLLASFPAGLVIYWAWSNTLSIVQQWYINKKNGAEVHLGANLKRQFGALGRLFGAKSEKE